MSPMPGTEQTPVAHGEYGLSRGENRRAPGLGGSPWRALRCRAVVGHWCRWWRWALAALALLLVAPRTLAEAKEPAA